MKIAFYAPLKSPNHPVPSGDRLMARLLIAALQMAGHDVEVASELRGFMAVPVDDPGNEVVEAARQEVDGLLDRWRQTGAPPDLWFSYHTYYKTPDLLGPVIASMFGIPYITAEASYAKRHDASGWAANQRLVTEGVRQAAVNLCFTERDRAGLVANIPDGRYERLLPFIDVEPFRQANSQGDDRRLVTVAMMRPGDKYDSYVMLAKALEMIRDRDWTLTVIGGGRALAEVQALFSSFDPGRILWLGERSADEIRIELQKGGIYVWPGCGEAYGLAYLEAQAAGLPVVAQSTAGVPEVVVDGVTGLLTPEGDVKALSQAIALLLDDRAQRREMGEAAFRFVHDERSLSVVSQRLDAILRHYLGTHHDR
ncbi:glycosyltransferase [Neorhizobium sp. P12A]|uniref:glycosyltransferase family 4 protein n=1 Tax=Neorhizobium sp. P12A TaxID=2268027 RepID=UPI0011EBF210|nr:glycosyltransferase family 4 protein [Neorhizobium sp. P12A]KAA0695669.1 glycosyltransferase [Neorhizobium sp. P12A]